jgi:hypothetical protein
MPGNFERLNSARIEWQEREPVGFDVFEPADLLRAVSIRNARQRNSDRDIENIDFGTMADLYGNTSRGSELSHTLASNSTSKWSSDRTSVKLSINTVRALGKDTPSNENSQNNETPAQGETTPGSTPSSTQIDTPSSGYADESPESNSNPTLGFPDSDPVPTENQEVAVAMAAVANTTAFSPCCNSTNQAETVTADPEGLNVEGQTEGTSASNSDDGSNSNAPGNDAEGDNGSDGSGGGSNSGGDSGGGGDGGDGDGGSE